MAVEFEKSQTKINLARAFAGETQEGARYQFIATKATEEGYNYLATLLKTIAKNEMAHAKEFYEAIFLNSKTRQDNIDIAAGYPFKDGDLLANIKNSLDNEHSEIGIYTDMAKIAEKEGYEGIAKLFRLVSTVENCHYAQLTQIYEKMKNGKLYKSPTPIKWKCSNCGFEHTDKKPWEKCPLCNFTIGHVQIPLDQGKN